MTGIYKITNKLNNKSYIGQSTNIIKRFNKHKTQNSLYDHQYNTPFHKAIREDGIENFIFEILEECGKEDLNQKEMYYIEKYNTSFPNGYNMSYGGKTGSLNKIYSFEDVLSIKKLIKDNTMLLSDIAKQYGVTLQTISDINAGKRWHDENEIYPLRKRVKHNDICKKCGKVIFKGTKYHLCRNCYNQSKKENAI